MLKLSVIPYTTPMKSRDRKIQRIAEFEPGDIEKAHSIVDEHLGGYACLEVGVFPKNVGSKGDEGVHGETVALVPMDLSGARYMFENPDLLAMVSTELTKEVDAITRVLVILQSAPDGLPPIE